jgi:hypothetical protein
MAKFTGNPKNPAGRNRSNPQSPERKREAKRADAELRQKQFSALSFDDKLARQKEGGKVWKKIHAHTERAALQAKRAAEETAQDVARKAAKAAKS